MNGYFERLGCLITEKTKLSKVIKNLLPFYQYRLIDSLPTTFSELRTVCRQKKGKRNLIKSYVEPSTLRRASVLEKDLTFVGIGDGIDSVDTSSGPRH